LCEHESLMEDEVEREGPTAAKLSVDNNQIWQIAFTLMMSEELVEGSRVKPAVEEIFSIANYALCYRSRGGGAATQLSFFVIISFLFG
jgi:hypothetical protein